MKERARGVGEVGVRRSDTVEIMLERGVAMLHIRVSPCGIAGIDPIGLIHVVSAKLSLFGRRVIPCNFGGSVR